MLVRMIKGKDLYYDGELVSLPDPRARSWIAQGYAELALCPVCGGELQDAGCRAYCDGCGYKQNLHW